MQFPNCLTPKWLVSFTKLKSKKTQQHNKIYKKNTLVLGKQVRKTHFPSPQKWRESTKYTNPGVPNQWAMVYWPLGRVSSWTECVHSPHLCVRCCKWSQVLAAPLVQALTAPLAWPLWTLMAPVTQALVPPLMRVVVAHLHKCCGYLQPHLCDRSQPHLCEQWVCTHIHSCVRVPAPSTKPSLILHSIPGHQPRKLGELCPNQRSGGRTEF